MTQAPRIEEVAMAQYTIRVELHGTGFNDAAYQRLHAAMEARGFERTIRDAQTGIVYWLPPAEYILVTAETDRRQICTLAEQGAATTGYQYSVLVTGPATCMWTNLEQQR